MLTEICTALPKLTFFLSEKIEVYTCNVYLSTP